MSNFFSGRWVVCFATKNVSSPCPPLPTEKRERERKKERCSFATLPNDIERNCHVAKFSFFHGENSCLIWAVVAPQLVEWSLPTPEVRGSNPVISKMYNEHWSKVIRIEKIKIKKKRPGKAFKNNCFKKHGNYCWGDSKVFNDQMPLNYSSRGGRHSSVVLSAPTILWPWIKSQAHHLCFFQFVLLILYRENNENKQKEAGVGPFLK